MRFYKISETVNGRRFYATLDEAKAAAREVAAALDKTIEIDSKNALAYNARGYVYSLKKDYDQAIDRAIGDYTKAIEIDPKLGIAYRNLGNAYYGQREYDRVHRRHLPRDRLDFCWCFPTTSPTRYSPGKTSSATCGAGTARAKSRRANESTGTSKSSRPRSGTRSTGR